MTVEQLRSLHHWAGTHTEAKVTYATVRDYFEHKRDMRQKNSTFADRLQLMAELHRRGIPALLEGTLRIYPSNPAAWLGAEKTQLHSKPARADRGVKGVGWSHLVTNMD